jgi:hypothetical protein
VLTSALTMTTMPLSRYATTRMSSPMCLLPILIKRHALLLPFHSGQFVRVSIVLGFAESLQVLNLPRYEVVLDGSNYYLGSNFRRKDKFFPHIVLGLTTDSHITWITTTILNSGLNIQHMDSKTAIKMVNGLHVTLEIFQVGGSILSV